MMGFEMLIIYKQCGLFLTVGGIFKVALVVRCTVRVCCQEPILRGVSGLVDDGWIGARDNCAFI